VLALRDKNHDGVALDLGEIVVFADGISAPVDIVALPAELAGDFNRDGIVDVADYVAWRKGVGVPSTPDNYNLWRTHFGETSGVGSGATGSASDSVPEPGILPFAGAGVFGLLSFSRRRAWRRRGSFSMDVSSRGELS
jgi:hypothetical protein